MSVYSLFKTGVILIYNVYSISYFFYYQYDNIKDDTSICFVRLVKRGKAVGTSRSYVFSLWKNYFVHNDVIYFIQVKSKKKSTFSMDFAYLIRKPN